MNDKMANNQAQVFVVSGINFFNGQLGGPRTLPFHPSQVQDEVSNYNFLKSKDENLGPSAGVVPAENVEVVEEPLECNGVLFGVANLLDQIGKRIQATLRDGRNIIGSLVSLDHFSNLIMRNTVERIFVGKEYCDMPFGVSIIRGDNLVMIGEVGEENELEMQRILKKVSVTQILEAQKFQKQLDNAKQRKYSEALKERGFCCSRRQPHVNYTPSYGTAVKQLRNFIFIGNWHARSRNVPRTDCRCMACWVTVESFKQQQSSLLLLGSRVSMGVVFSVLRSIQKCLLTNISGLPLSDAPICYSRADHYSICGTLRSGQQQKWNQSLHSMIFLELGIRRFLWPIIQRRMTRMEASRKYTSCNLEELKAMFPLWNDRKIFEVHDLFQAFEVDGDGLVEITEMSVGLDNLGDTTLRSARLEQLNLHDQDDTGCLDFEEFLQMIYGQQALVDEPLAKTFNRVNHDIKLIRSMSTVQQKRIYPEKPGKKRDIYSRSHIKQSKTHQIKHMTRRPPGSVPPFALSTWKDMTPDVKLPDLRNKSDGNIYYSRGRLCQKLNKEKPEFDLSDPYNKRKVHETRGHSGYSALHDPHCKSYFYKPTVLKHLKKQKLINEREEVLCNVHEFNHYRSYLGELFNDQVKRRINDSEGMKSLERDLSRSISSKQKKYLLDSNKQYQLEHIQATARYREIKRQQYIQNIREWRKRLTLVEQQRLEMTIARKGMYTRKHWNAHLTREKGGEQEAQRKKHTLTRIAYAEIKNDYVTKYDKFVRLALRERYKADQVAVMVARDDQIDDMEQLVDETLKRARASWLKKYNGFVDKCRENPLHNYQTHLEAEQRIIYLMKKYFTMWKQFVAKLKRKRPDEGHQSNFNVDKQLQPYVEDLKELSPEELQAALLQGKTFAELRREKKQKSKLTDSVSKPHGKQKKSKSEQTEDMENGQGHGDHNRKKPPKKQIDEDACSTTDCMEESDDFIDNLIKRLQYDQGLFKQKLRTHRGTTLQHHVPSHLLTIPNNMKLDVDQEMQQEIITSLFDINLSTVPVDKDEIAKGWKLMHKK
ncbi:U6 snRNA-associated Sm-like protein LSm1 [Orchesella cincta]|uniref:U6 snRNA-associated Sm-like protein LSm1 n=1 Tax=Orchesella cincta TaxID=48709 RepID=A0A1D2MIC5_ORCCI|nr:U6 snRNA-associated Sm-like protein LSm1 [Orchesella cincta]